MGLFSTWKRAWAHRGYTLESSASDHAAIVPSDTIDLTEYPRAIYIGGAGKIKVTLEGGGTETYTGLIAGSILPVIAKRVWSTGTDATLLIGMY